jgi:hypothetical protein
MDHRHRLDGPPGPPGEEPTGWVVAGEEGSDWPPNRDNGHADPGWRDQSAGGPGWYAPAYDPGYGGVRYGDPPPSSLPEPDYPAGMPTRSDPGGGWPATAGRRPSMPADRRSPAPAGRWSSRRRPLAGPEPPDDPGPTGWLPALLWTASLFVLPALLYLGWTMTLSGEPTTGCLEATGTPCPPPRTEAVGRLADVLPGLAAALMLGLLVALGLRRVTADWRDSTVGFAAAVIGAGLATLVGAVIG